ncbi:MAG: redox-regulated ATPase YchF [Candidatus Dojkabacteria bacterium]|nr:redox-regulated ATPase YchF [Candidatus Dojkabacteria bacterium]MDQ7021098.1 redox-regulated ATPase YchF [Candidatus Dojkabacteria bacterium]
MKLSLGIVGLPNVGKSTLFNALTKQQVLAENYPFATIDPNVGVVAVHDERINKIAEVVKPNKTVSATVEFVDIAGLVKGAAEGAGLGNKFLANIRETNAIVHLVRAFNDGNITHVENGIDPKRDIELINIELILKDLDSVKNKIGSMAAKAKFDQKLKQAVTHLEELYKHLEEGKLAVDFPMPKDEDVKYERRNIFLLTDKPVIYLVNATEDQFEESYKMVKEIVGDKDVITMDIKLEAELGEMDDGDRDEFMKDLGLEMTGLEKLTMEAYKLLGLISYFTAGVQEVRAWTIKKGENAKQAARAIHNDISDNFIAADVTSWDAFVELGGWVKVKDGGKLRLEGKEYIVADGDVVLFKHNG